ncbi:thrombospondin [Micromonospora sp. HUAS LYJ1]|uniref:thrombospondin n=1 Tax=Micromonospora sp. HUAS LYJ1 TaxID=3061626 RepID=UPI0026721788|nr:thrombospondin [Micromonospora sp. HUAS LYJ1]WKU08180.1 thrombospondin [Micromonospora sp. HUAS LYJ1]
MNVPSLLRRRTATQDSNGDGVVDARDGQPVVTDRATYRSGSLATDGGRTADDERRAAERGALARAATARSAVDGTRSAAAARSTTVDDEPRTPTDPMRVTDPAPRPVPDRPVDRDRPPVPPPPAGTRPADGVDTDGTGPQPPVVAGPKPRSSLLATFGLIVSVVGAGFVLTGTLAGYGIALGAFGAVCSVLGLIATRRRHVAGTTDALVGVLVGLAAVVLGVLAFTGQFDWPTTDGDWVARFREWLDSQFVDRF